jgi:hypothetical protein
MKAILEFNLPEEQTDFYLATKGKDWWKVCWDMEQWLRQQNKHMPDNRFNKDKDIAYLEVREMLIDIMNENGVNFEDV